jgi:pyruvate/2-oxoglutarate dehydrogenase complex dihydrolipoamide acyltransferase (E2) component
VKIFAELIRVRQDWDPDTNTHHNSVIFAFAGVQVEVPATPEQVKAIIVESQRHIVMDRRSVHGGELSPATYPAPPVAAAQKLGWGADQPVDESAGGAELDGALADELTAEEGERVFGGDFSDPDVPLRTAPALFEGPAPSLDAALAAAEPQAPAPPPTPTQQRQAALEAKREADPAARRAATQQQMRQRAQLVPMRRVAKDDQGNPIVHEDRSKPIRGSAGAPTVEVRRTAPQVTHGGDDDGFGQG